MVPQRNRNRRGRAVVHTLGCRLNQSESQLLKDQLTSAGYAVVPFGQEADLGIINTCTVTREADAKCRQAIRGFIRKNPEAFTAVVGCYSQMGAKVLSEIPGVDLIVGNQDKLSVLDYARAGKNDRPLVVRDRIDKKDFTIHFAGDIPFNKRANLKVQDGCDFMCSFCIIPFARGRARSRDFENLLDEARAMAARGIREVVLTGVNIGTFDNAGENITGVVDALNEVSGLVRVRISSIEPTTIPEDLFERMADPSHVLMPFLHIPLQSGCDSVLETMRRRYTVREFLDFIAMAESRVPDICIGTDIMVGSAGESAAMFDETCRVFLESPLAYCHVFPYSERDGTLALHRDDHVPVPERVRRSVHLRRLSAQKRWDYNARYVGCETEVLFEDPREGAWPGYTANYVRVLCDPASGQAPAGQDLANRRAIVRLEHQTADFIEGTVVRIVDGA